MKWIIAAIIGALWHVLWVTWLSPISAAIPERVVEPPRVAYLSIEAQPDGYSFPDDLLALWSPSLFALPSRSGFSQSIEQEVLASHPRLEAPTLTSVYLSRVRESDDDGSPRYSVEPLSTIGGGLPPLLVERVLRNAFPAFTPSGEGVMWRLESDTIPLEEVRADALPAREPFIDQGAWVAVACVEVGPEGIVRHVYLESATDLPLRNRELVQALYRWRFKPASEDRTGKLILSYKGQPDMRRVGVEVTGP